MMTTNNKNERNDSGKCLGLPVTSYGPSYKWRISLFKLFCDGNIETVSCCSKHRIETNLQKVTKFPERSATLRNFDGFQFFVVKPLFEFLNFIGPFTKKGAILCSQLTLLLVNFVSTGPVQVVAL